MEEEEDDSDAAYNAETDVDEDDDGKSASRNGAADLDDFPPLPEFFSGVVFAVIGDFSTGERKALRQLIVGAGGDVSAYMGDDVDVVVTNSKWNEDFDGAIEDNGRLKFVKPGYVHSSWKSQSRAKWADFAVRRKHVK